MSKFLLIGLDAADWELISEKIKQGRLPNLSRLIKTGVSGPLRSLRPLFSPALWATMATGKRPYEHGVTGFAYVDHLASELVTYNSTSLRVPTLWNILSHAKKTSHVLGWWNTAPAEAIEGVVVDETFRRAEHPATEPWIARSSSVSPISFLEELKKHRTHPQKLQESLLHRLVPKLYEINPQEDLRIAGMAQILAEDLTTLEASLYLMRETHWDFSTLCLMGIDRLCHQHINDRSPLLPNQKPRDNELYGEVVDRAYELYDEWIGTLVAAAGKEATVMIISDHGFYYDHRRLQNIGIQSTSPCAQHAPIGTMILNGPSIKKEITISDASILDICPTILSFFGLPIGKDMPGKVLTKAFQKSCEKKWITSWNHIKSKAPKKNLTPSTEANEAALRQLVALGYLSDLPWNTPEALQEAYCDDLFHRSLSYLENEKYDQALDLLEKARKVSCKGHLARTDILQILAEAYLVLKKYRNAAANFLQLVRVRRRDARLALQKLILKETKIRSTTQISSTESSELRYLIARAHLDEKGMKCILTLAQQIASQETQSPAELKASPHWKKICQLAEEHPHDTFLNFHVGKIALELDIDEIGLRLLERVNEEHPEEALALSLIAEHKNRKGLFLDAEELAQNALKKDPLHASSWLALATALTYQQRWKEARTAALQARQSVLRKSELCNLLAIITSQSNGNPRHASRYLALGERAQNYLEKCASAYEKKSSSQLVYYSHGVQNDVSARNQEFIIVTGIPRSGTSLVMQMLAAGGVPIMTDGVRVADEHNPRGYFEDEKIKSIGSDARFLEVGKAAKIVTPLLWELPARLPVKIIFIQRDLAEVIESQYRMAGKMGSREELEEVYRYYEAKTEEIITEYSWPVLRLSHASVLQNPQAAAKAIENFLGSKLDTEVMASAVDQNLHRVKKN